MTSNKYTYGNEYVVATTGQDYIGLYHITNQGNVYTGKSPNSFDKQLLLTKNQSVALNETSQQYVALQQQQGNQFKIILPDPPSYFPQPEESDYDRGYFTRYFTKKINDRGISTLKEIDQQTYSKINSNSKDYDSYMWKTTQSKWVLTGSINGSITNGVVKKGVRNANYNLIFTASQLVEGLEYFIKDYTQFARLT